MKKYRLGYTTLEESKKFVEVGLSIETADMSYTYDFDDSRYVVTTTPAKNWIIPKYAESTKIKQVLPCWSLTRIVNILENNDIKVSYEDKSWCLKTNVIEKGLRHCFVGSNLPKLVIEMLESKIVEFKRLSEKELVCEDKEVHVDLADTPSISALVMYEKGKVVKVKTGF